MTPNELNDFLERLVTDQLRLSTMIWGPAGIGKSSIVAQVAQRHDLEFVDVRLSQLAPSDLRGLPVAVDGVSRWYPPEFLPQRGRGILFLDEVNLAPPAMQGIAQQLILDRKIGSYTVPDEWFIWAAGNRKEDRASFFEMPAPLANRFLHLQVAPDWDSFKAFALAHGINERILAFLSFRPTLLHHLDPQAPAWPSPRSWSMASHLMQADLSPEAAVGAAAAAELSAFSALYDSLPDLDAILDGKGDSPSFPSEPSVRFALTIGLTVRAETVERGLRAFHYLAENAGPEWVQLFASDLVRLLRDRGQLGTLAQLVQREEQLGRFLKDYQELMNG
jgi:MoxR-like ATPase